MQPPVQLDRLALLCLYSAVLGTATVASASSFSNLTFFPPAGQMILEWAGGGASFSIDLKANVTTDWIRLVAVRPTFSPAGANSSNTTKLSASLFTTEGSSYAATDVASGETTIISPVPHSLFGLLSLRCAVEPSKQPPVLVSQVDVFLPGLVSPQAVSFDFIGWYWRVPALSSVVVTHVASNVSGHDGCCAEMMRDFNNTGAVFAEIAFTDNDTGSMAVQSFNASLFYPSAMCARVPEHFSHRALSCSLSIRNDGQVPALVGWVKFSTKQIPSADDGGHDTNLTNVEIVLCVVAGFVGIAIVTAAITAFVCRMLHRGYWYEHAYEQK